jgi:hypothetical protein
MRRARPVSGQTRAAARAGRHRDQDEGDIVTDQETRAGIQLDRRLLLTGGVLAGVGGVLASTGIVMLSAAFASALRRWVQQLDQPPSQIARHKWQQARTATTAGVQAWQRTSPSAGE